MGLKLCGFAVGEAVEQDGAKEGDSDGEGEAEL